jgi:hypothetical protein
MAVDFQDVVLTEALSLFDRQRVGVRVMLYR